MAQKNTTTALAPVENFSLKTMYEDMDPELVEELRDQMGDLDDEQGIDCRKIKIPSGGGKSYEVEDDNDTVDMRTIRGVIVFTHRVNAYWETELGAAGSDENRAPTCSSLDGKVGTVDATGEVRTCDTCPMNAFGTSIKGGKGKACKNMRRVYLLMDGDPHLYLLTIPPTSIRDFNKLLTRLMARGIPYTNLILEFKLEEAKNAGGIKYSKVAFDAVGTVPQTLAQQISTIRKGIKEKFSSLAISAADYNAPAQDGTFTELPDPPAGSKEAATPFEDAPELPFS